MPLLKTTEGKHLSDTTAPQLYALILPLYIFFTITVNFSTFFVTIVTIFVNYFTSFIHNAPTHYGHHLTPHRCAATLRSNSAFILWLKLVGFTKKARKNCGAYLARVSNRHDFWPDCRIIV